jgi:hypothetical protein
MMILPVLVRDYFDVKGCVIKADNKENETISCLGELMCKLTTNVAGLKGRARVIAPREFQLLVILNWQSSQTIMLHLCTLSSLRSYIMMVDLYILSTQ